MRHTLGLFHGQAGSSFWKRYLSENMCVRDADVKKIDHIMDKITFKHINKFCELTWILIFFQINIFYLL